MTAIKSYTDIEQSRKLAEILQLESADAFYVIGKKPVNIVVIYGFVTYKTLKEQIAYKRAIPCWSLAALRNLLPVGIKINENTYLFESHNTFDKCWVYRYYNEDDTSYLYCKNINEVDACYEMILKLNELNLL